MTAPNPDPSACLCAVRPSGCGNQDEAWAVGQHGEPSEDQYRAGRVAVAAPLSPAGYWPFQKAVSVLPTAVDYWALLILAHKRSGDVHAARALISDMRAQVVGNAWLSVSLWTECNRAKALSPFTLGRRSQPTRCTLLGLKLRLLAVDIWLNVKSPALMGRFACELLPNCPSIARAGSVAGSTLAWPRLA